MTPTLRRSLKASGISSKALSSNDNLMGKIPTRTRCTHEPQTNCEFGCSGWRLRTVNVENPLACFLDKSRSGVLNMAGRRMNRVTPISHRVNVGRRWSYNFLFYPKGKMPHAADIPVGDRVVYQVPQRQTMCLGTHTFVGLLSPWDLLDLAAPTWAQAV